MNELPILLVEDDVNDVFFFRRAMKEADFTHPLRVARDGAEALDYLTGKGAFADRAQFPLPCLIVLDLNLPRQHGLEVLRWIRERDPDNTVPVVVLTSSTSERDMIEAYRDGANSYLNKPSSPTELVAVVSALKGYWFGLNRVPAMRGLDPAPSPPGS